MPQLHCYVPKEVATAVRRRAEARGLTVSGYLGEVVRREIGGGWPAGFFDEVIGGWRGELERPPQPPLERRRKL